MSRSRRALHDVRYQRLEAHTSLGGTWGTRVLLDGSLAREHAAVTGVEIRALIIDSPELRRDTPTCEGRAITSGCGRRAGVMASIESAILRYQLHAV